MRSKNIRKNSLISRIGSMMLTLVLVVNMLVGYVPMKMMTYEEVKAATTNLPYRNVMYYGEWSVYAGQKNFTPDKIDGSLITHLNFAFMDVDKDGNLLVCDHWADFDNQNVGYSVDYGSPYSGVLGAFPLLRQQYPNMRIGISVGGWTRSGDFPAMAANPTARKNFAKNVAKFVHYYGYDFVDIDWEYPTADRDPDPTGNGVAVDKGCKGSEADVKNFTYLMQDIRAELDSYGKKDGKYYELSVAMSANPAMMAKIEYDKVLEVIDFANMMTYDLNGAWADFTAHQTALYTNDSYDKETMKDAAFSVDTCVKYLEETYGNSIDYSKIVIGVAPYTRGWAGVQNNGLDPDNPGLYASAKPNSVTSGDGTTSGTFAYSDIGTLISQYNLKEYYDEKAEAAYYYSAETGYFFTCDNERSVAAKGDYVKKKGLGGLISWMASLDAANSITKVMKQSLYGNSALPNNGYVVPPMENIGVNVSTAGNTYTITVTNNNALTESSAATTIGSGDKAAMPGAETFGETATYPKFYIKMKNGEVLTSSGWNAETVGSANGCTTIDVLTYDNKFFGPGKSFTATLNSSSTANASNIESITMTRKATASGVEFGSQVVYGNGAAIEPATTAPGATSQDVTSPSDGSQVTTPVVTTPSSGGGTGGTATGSYPAWSPNNVSYGLGDLVSYNGKVYECIYAHASNSAWSPVDAPTLWKERPDLINAEEPSSGAGGGGEQETDDNYTVNGILPQHMVTGYWHNFVNGSANLKLSQVPSYYDMICVAFTGNTATAGEVTFEIDPELSAALGGYSKAEFIQDIKNLKAKGQHVIVSVGGAEGRIEINSADAANRFANGLINIIREYGFEGVDIDLEGAAVSGVDYIADALRKVHNEFGDNFIITMAPETYYIQADRISANDITTSYLRLALKIKDILTICYPQFYNSGGMIGYGGQNVNPGTADFLTSLSTMIIEAGLRPDQVAFGVPSMEKAAGSGYVSNDIIKKALDSMVNGTSSGNFTPPKAYPTFRGVMTWSINWDATRDYAWAKAMDTYMDQMPKVDVGTTPTETTSKNPGSTARPTEVTGLAVTSQSGSNVTFAWGQTSEQISSGQSYKVYIDGKLYNTYSAASSVTVSLANGSHTIKVTAALNGYETTGSTLNVTVSTETKPGEQPTQPSGGSGTDGLQSTLLIGYWHTWHNDGNPFIKLRDVDDDWDVINISFTEPVSPGSTDGKMKFNISGLTADYTIDDFKADVKLLQSRGKKVVLAIGGYDGFFSLTSQAAVNTFVSDIKAMIDEYGFDGIDIDLEQYSVQFDSGNDPDINNPRSPKIVHMINAIRTIVNSYGDDFILSWAPETFYMQMGYKYYGGINAYCDARAGVYLPMINALRDETSFVHVQLYNSISIKAPDGITYDMGTKEATVAMCKMLLDGFYVGADVGVAKTEQTYFAPLRPDQVVIGVPASTSAAGSGQISNEALQAAFTELNASYPGMRGIMTWSINWDVTQNNNSFANINGAFLDGYLVDTPEPPSENPTTATFDAFQKIEAEKFAYNQGGVIDPNANASGGSNIGGILDGVYMRYDNVNFSSDADKFNIYYSSPSGTALGNVEIYVDSLDNLVGTIVLPNNASSWQQYGVTTGTLDKVITAGKHTIYTKYVTTGTVPYVANVDYFSFGQYTGEDNTIEGGIEINGYQISTKVGGMRTIYSVESTINGKAVVESGLVYAIAEMANASDMYVGSDNRYVASYKSTTSIGLIPGKYTGSSKASSYAMTMRFAVGNAAEFSDEYMIRAYAKLSDGTYVYTDVTNYSVYEIADVLYQNNKMSSETGHNYLYNKILSVVNPGYKTKDYHWRDEIFDLL